MNSLDKSRSIRIGILGFGSLERKGNMPVNMLRKDIQKGQKPSGCSSSSQTIEEQNQKEKRDQEIELSHIEEQALWESQELGIVRWSGENDNRFSDPGA